MDRSQGRQQPVQQQPGQEQRAPRQRGQQQASASHLTPPDPLSQPAASLPNVRQERAVGYRPHPSEVGRDFQIHHPGPESGPLIGKYVGPGNDGQHLFDVHRHGRLPVPEGQILGYRPTVGGMHPPGRVRPPEENLAGRDRVHLSAADLSEPMALQRRDPRLADRMAVTTFEHEPNYKEFKGNQRNLNALGVPVVPGVDISKTDQTAQRLSELPSGANLHFQMPRVPRGVSGYSTQKLVHDTLSLPGAMERKDMSVSITTPHPRAYEAESTHNRIYGLESCKALEGTDMQLKEEGSDSDGLEEFGYRHRQTTKDAPAAVAAKRKTYKFEPLDSGDESEGAE